MDDLLELLLPIAQDAAAEIMKVYASPFDVDFKGEGGNDPVTEADRRANGLICERLERHFPGVVVVAEESAEVEWQHFRSEKRAFFVDPLDGTQAFVAKNDGFVVMIGLLDGDEPTHGLLFSPVTKTAWLGHVGNTESPARAIAVAADGSRRTLKIKEAPSLSQARVVSSRSSDDASLLERGLRQLGAQTVLPIHSAGLKAATVASGQADIYMAPEHAGCRWDSCAAEAVIRAAGGLYTDALGIPLDYRASSLENLNGIVAAAPETHAHVIECLAPLLL